MGSESIVVVWNCPARHNNGSLYWAAGVHSKTNKVHIYWVLHIFISIAVFIASIRLKLQVCVKSDQHAPRQRGVRSRESCQLCNQLADLGTGSSQFISITMLVARRCPSDSLLSKNSFFCVYV